MKKLFEIDVRVTCVGHAFVYAETEAEALAKLAAGEVEGIHLTDIEKIDPLAEGGEVEKSMAACKLPLDKVSILK